MHAYTLSGTHYGLLILYTCPFKNSIIIINFLDSLYLLQDSHCPRYFTLIASSVLDSSPKASPNAGQLRSGPKNVKISQTMPAMSEAISNSRSAMLNAKPFTSAHVQCKDRVRIHSCSEKCSDFGPVRQQS